MDASQFELSPIKAIELAAARVPGAVSLAQGIPSFATPTVIKNFVTQRINEGLCDKYSLTTGLAELREEIAMALVQEGLHYDPDSEIIATAGSIEGLTASVLALTEPGDEVIIPAPTYASYRGALGIARCTPVFVALDEDRNFDFQVDLIRRAITKRTKAILYCSPNNPTGTVYSEQKTRELMELVLEHNLYVIIDEVYKDFYYGEEKHFSPTKIPEVRNNIIRVCSFSKAYAMTGWRIGFLHADAKQVSKIVKYHDAMVTCAPVVSQYAAIAALRFGDSFRREFVREFKLRRDTALAALDGMSHVLDYQLPKATYFVFPRIKDTVALSHDSTRLAYDILEKVGVATVPGVAFGPSGESHLRINFGRSEEDLKEGLGRLEQYFSVARKQHQVTRKNQISAGPPVASLSRRIGATLLGSAARIYLRRNRPKVIGIVGLRGKTVFKRMIAEALQAHHPTRASILSYNTEIGLPLSILNLYSPLTLSGKVKLIFSAFRRALLEHDSARILVLEFGILSAQDAETLLSIVHPEWLVVTDVSSPDPNLDLQSFRDGLTKMVQSISSDRILWADENNAPEQFNLKGAPAMNMSSKTYSETASLSSNDTSNTNSMKHARLTSEYLVNALR